MNQWLNNKELHSMSEKCDDAFLSKNASLLEKLSNECEANSKEDNLSLLEKFNYLYNSFTALSNAISINIRDSAEKDKTLSKTQLFKQYENDYEHRFYLARLCYDIIKKGTSNYKTQKVRNKIDFLYSRFLVNYSNLLRKNGRLVSSIDLVSIFFNKNNNFTMGQGSLGISLWDYAYMCSDQGHQDILFRNSYNLIIKALENVDNIPEKEEAKPELLHYKNMLESMYEKDFLEKKMPITKLITPCKKMSNIEKKYRSWIAKNKLSLNLLNDIYTDTVVAYDPLLLPNVFGGMEVKDFIGLFNQIKQEYVSARFLLYEGVSENKAHFSNKDIKLVDTLNYPIYSLNIEKIKLSYRSCYSILDKVAFFLNEYFELNISQANISFDRIWNIRKTKNDKEELLNIADENYYLLGIYWIYKDIYSRYDDEYKETVTKEYEQIVELRNALEHRYLKVNEDFSNNIDDVWTDKLAYNITLSDLKSTTTLCFKLVREVIILLVLTINCNEYHKKNINDKDVPEIFLDEY